MVLSVEVFHFAVVILVLLTKRVYYSALGLYLRLQVLIGLLDHEHFFLLCLLLLQELLLFKLLFLQFVLEFSVFHSLILLLFS